MDFLDLNSLRSPEELADYQRSVRGRLSELNAEFAGLPFPDEAREEFARLQGENTEVSNRLVELRARNDYIQRMAEDGDPSRTERVGQDVIRSMPRPSMRERDIFDLSTVPASLTDSAASGRELHERAQRAVEVGRFSHTDRSKAQQKVSELLEHDDERGSIARRILTTGSPTYQRAFHKALLGQALAPEEARALSLTGTAGGYAVPYDLDPTIIPTSNGVVNPWRQISRVVQTTTDTWRGVSSGAITASYAAEAAETTDNSPTLSQPEVTAERAQAFIPFSIEVGMDWGGLRAEMGLLLQEAKDDLEAAKFATGTGTNEPFGVITGATNTVNAAAGADAFTIANLYALMGALPPRYRPRASFVANLAILNRIRQFDTAGGAALWETLAGDTPDQLLGRPVYESSAMAADALTGSLFLIFGDFSRFVIVDRIGLEVELIPHLMGANRRPTGQRGLYAFWRNGAKVVDANAFRTLIGTA